MVDIKNNNAYSIKFYKNLEIAKREELACSRARQ